MAERLRSRTAVLVALALLGLAVSAYLAAFQLGFIASPWEPFFGDGSRRVLTSDLSRVLPVPDAVMGASLYLVDAILGVALLARPRGLHRVAVTLALIASAGAAVGIFLIAYQALVVGAFCTLCLSSAGISWLLAGGTILEARERLSASRAAGAVDRDDSHDAAGTARPMPLVATGPATAAVAAGPASTTPVPPPVPSSIPKGEPHPMIVVITGASAGVGRATARAFAADGWDVGLIARGEAGLEAAAEEVRVAGRRALVLPLDVADADAVDAAAERVEQELGPIDAWVNVAMESVFAPVAETTPDEYRRVTEVNYLGYVHGTLSALRRMTPRDRGVIVEVGSALAYRSIPLQSAYCATKHAIVGFTDSLRCELVHDGSHVRVTAVHLPAVNTPQFGWVRSRLPNRAQPVPPIFDPEVPARAILAMAKHPRRELLVGWPTYLSVWGQKFAPGIMDVYLGRTGYAGQQTDEARPDRPDNLDRPLDAAADRGAHGRFDDQAHSWSPMLEVALHPRLVVGLVAAGAAALVIGLWRAVRTGPDGAAGR